MSQNKNYNIHNDGKQPADSKPVTFPKAWRDDIREAVQVMNRGGDVTRPTQPQSVASTK